MPFRVLYWQKIFFLLGFYAIMHRTTIVKNKIISIICSCLFFCLANIYRPSLGKVWLGRPNPNISQSLNIYLKREKKTFLRIVCSFVIYTKKKLVDTA